MQCASLLSIKEWAEFSNAVEGSAEAWICGATDDILKLKVSIIDPLDWFTG